MTFPSPPATLSNDVYVDVVAHEAQFASVDTALRQAIQARLDFILPLPEGPPLPPETPLSHARNLLLEFGFVIVSYEFEPDDEIARPVRAYKLSGTYRQLQQELLSAGWLTENYTCQKAYLSRETLELSIKLRALKTHPALTAPA